MNAMATTTTAPLKGKTKDEPPTQPMLPSHWWNFYALAEQRRRPLVWTSSAILFAHEIEPAIVGRAFPSSRQFRLPSPAVVANTPGSYEPPTIFCVSPREDWLFAYFPGRQIPGVGCFWRAEQADGWDIVESISFPRSRGVVTAKWLGHAREWVADSGRNTSRLPPLGPAVLASLPTLILVTQNLQVQLCCVRASPQQPKIVVTSCPLEKPDEVRDPAPSNLDSFDSRCCTHATIGLGYNESSILVATRSRPNVLPLESSFVSLGIEEVPELSPQFHDVHSAESIDWESWAQESNIDLCEVRIIFDGSRTFLFTNPLSALRCDAHPLSSLMFCPGDPVHPAVAESSPPHVLPKMYLCLSFLDFGKSDDRTSGMENRPGSGADSAIPKSELIVCGLFKRPHPHPHPNIPEWSSTKLTSKSFYETLAFILPHYRSPRANTIIAGSLSPQGPASYSKRNASVKPPSGSVMVLKLPSLDLHPDWESEPLLMGWSESSYGCPPVSVALSPNATLLCAISQSTTIPSKLTIHTMPKKFRNDNSVVEHPRVPDFVSVLISAMRTKRTVSDVAHQLSLGSVSVQEVESVLCELLEALESHDYGLRGVWFHEFLGMLLEVYRLKGERIQKKLDKEDFTTRWKTIQDLCSVIACHSAFEDCKDGDNVGLEYSWPLIVQSTWFLGFLEELMRECVLLGDSREGLGEEVTEKQTIPSTHPILLNLLYPDALTKLRVTVGDVKGLYEQLKGVDPNGENGTIARNALIDTVDSSGINLEALESLLTQISEKIDGSKATDVRRSIAACHLMPEVYPLLWGIARTVSKSHVIEKSRLFIKPQEFLSEVGESSESAGEGQDIVSKGILLRRRPTRVCVRCGGKSQHEISLRGDSTIPGAYLSQWDVWGRRWWSRCICGGRWVSVD